MSSKGKGKTTTPRIYWYTGPMDDGSDPEDDAPAITLAARNKSPGKKGKVPAPGTFVSDRLVWECQPDETQTAFAAFVDYRSTAPRQRSQRQTVDNLGLGAAVVGQWSAAWFWVWRARAYDNHRQREIDAAGLDEAKEQRRRHVRLAVLLQEAGARTLQRATEIEHDSELDGAVAVKAVVEGAKLERLVTGGVTSRTEIVVPWDDLNDEELLRIANGDEPDEVMRERAPAAAGEAAADVVH